MSDQEITLLLVGRTGHGKSSTGNSILGEKVFTPRGVTSDVTDLVEMAKRQIDGKTLLVVDGSNIGETDDEYPQNAKEMIASSDIAFQLCNKRFSALVLLLKYGIRFTKQERDAVLVIKSLFGSDVIQRHGVIVMTGGDHFARDAEDDGVTFRQWCDQQTGEVQKLKEECNQRVVLIDNKTKDLETLRAQREKLMAKVMEVSDQTGPYTEKDLERAEPGRRKLMVMTKMRQLQRDTDKFIEEMDKEIDVLGNLEDKDPKGNISRVTKLLGDIHRFEESLKVKDEDTGSVTSLIEKLNNLRRKLEQMYNKLEKVVYPEKVTVHPSKSGFGTPNPQTKRGSKQVIENSGEVMSKKSWLRSFFCCGTCRARRGQYKIQAD